MSAGQTTRGSDLACNLGDSLMSELTRAVSGCTLDGLFVIRSSGEIVMTNASAEALVGRSSEELLGAHISVIMPKVHALAHDSYVAAYEETGEAKMIGTNRVVTVVKADGSTLPAQLAVSATSAGGERYYVGSLRDVSQTEADAALKASILGVVLDPIVVINEVGIITLVNQSTQDMFGYSQDELVGTNVSILMPESVARHHDGYLAAYAQTGIPRMINTNREVLCKRRDGSTFPARLGLSQVDSGAGRLFVGILHDITLEREKAAADAASQLTSRFLANMSHEIRTPLNGILGLLQLLTMSTRLDPIQTSWVDTSMRSASALSSILDDILLFSRADSDAIQLETIPFNIYNVVEDIFVLLAPVNDNNSPDIDFAFFIDPAVPPFLRGDPTRLRQILINLTGNALKFTHKGQVALRLLLESPQQQDQDQDQDTPPEDAIVLRIEVTDSGIGIPQEKVDTLFTPFIQADASTTRKYGGTGLGLSICKKLVTLFGGQLAVESQVGVGSTFSFSAVFHADTEEHSSLDSFGVSDKEVSILSDTCILCIDDSEINGEYLTALLGKFGATVATARSGAQGMAMLEEAALAGRPFAVVLVDFRLPDDNGVDLAIRIQSNPVLTDTDLSTLILSRVHDQADIQHQVQVQGVATGVLLEYHIVAKPFRRAGVLGKISAALQGILECVSPVASPPELSGTGEFSFDDSMSSITSVVAFTESVSSDTPRPDNMVLVVDDNRVNVMCLVELLRQVGVASVAAYNGTEAYEAFVAAGPNGFDLVLMDLHMPIRSGKDAADDIRAWESEVGASSVPIVAITADMTPGLRGQLVKDVGEFDAFLNKPVRAETLFRTIANVAPKLGIHPSSLAGHNAPAPRDDSQSDETDTPAGASSPEMVADRDGGEDGTDGDSPTIPVFHSHAVRVLVVDDASANRMILGVALSMMGCDVVKAASGEEALVALESEGEDIDIVFCDLRMPAGMSGIETSVSIRAKGNSVPIIGMTADTPDDDIRSRARTAGMADVLEKPLNLTDLERILARHVRVLGLKSSRLNMSGPSSAGASSPNDPILEADALLEMVQGDATLADAILAELQQQASSGVGKIRTALTLNDFSSIAEVAHNIKGSASAAFATSLAAAASELRSAAISRDKYAIATAFEFLILQLQRLVHAARDGIDGWFSLTRDSQTPTDPFSLSLPDHLGGGGGGGE